MRTERLNSKCTPTSACVRKMDDEPAEGERGKQYSSDDGEERGHAGDREVAEQDAKGEHEEARPQRAVRSSTRRRVTASKSTGGGRQNYSPILRRHLEAECEDRKRKRTVRMSVGPPSARSTRARTSKAPADRRRSKRRVV